MRKYSEVLADLTRKDPVADANVIRVATCSARAYGFAPQRALDNLLLYSGGIHRATSFGVNKNGAPYMGVVKEPLEIANILAVWVRTGGWEMEPGSERVLRDIVLSDEDRDYIRDFIDELLLPEHLLRKTEFASYSSMAATFGVPIFFLYNRLKDLDLL